MLDRATILPESFTDNVKSAIVSAAEAKVNEAKTAVITRLDALFKGCERRRLGEVVEVKQDGSQRMLTGELAFSDLSQSIEVLVDGVVSYLSSSSLFITRHVLILPLVLPQMQTVTGGFYPGRQEIAVDLLIHLDEVFDKAYFTDAVNAIFSDFEPLQAMFGAASELPNVSALLNAMSSIVAFDMSFSTGVKVENALSVFSSGSDASVKLFFRLNNLGVFAEATVTSATLDIFPGVSVEGGNFQLSAGVRVAAPFEGEVSIDGSMATGISFSHSLTNLVFEPYGKLTSNLPFELSVNNFTQSLIIKFEDDNLFDNVLLLTKVDFPVCPIVSVVDGLLGKLGSLGLSPKHIIGQVETAGLDLGSTLNDYFPNLAQFMEGILEGKKKCIAAFDHESFFSCASHLTNWLIPFSFYKPH